MGSRKRRLTEPSAAKTLWMSQTSIMKTWERWVATADTKGLMLGFWAGAGVAITSSVGGCGGSVEVSDGGFWWGYLELLDS